MTSDVAAAAADAAEGPLSNFDLHGYRPAPDLADDVAYMDLVMLITRSSRLRQGSMGCLLVRPRAAGADDGNLPRAAPRGRSRILAAAINTSLFRPDDSDVHAEINALGQVARRAHATAPPSHAAASTQGATAYITMPPCKRCFGALFAAGITKIVSRKQHPEVLVKAAAEVGIEMRCLTRDELAQQQTRLGEFFASGGGGGAEDGPRHEQLDHGKAQEIVKQRKRRQEEKRARKMAKMTQHDEIGSGV